MKRIYDTYRLNDSLLVFSNIIDMEDSVLNELVPNTTSQLDLAIENCNLVLKDYTDSMDVINILDTAIKTNNLQNIIKQGNK